MRAWSAPTADEGETEQRRAQHRDRSWFGRRESMPYLVLEISAAGAVRYSTDRHRQGGERDRAAGIGPWR
jgi:hypothetical protein